MPMMKCGHVANATKEGKPVCVICYGIVPGADEEASTPNLTGRIATCPYNGLPVPSALGLPFFEYRPNMPTDSYYCGCRGWD